MIIRSLAYLANAAYFVALTWAAINISVAGHREPRGPLADWAAMDAWFSTAVAAGVVLYAITHAVAVLLWWQLGQLKPILFTTLPLAALLPLVWLGYERIDAPGWQLVLVGLAAAVASWLRTGRRNRATASGERATRLSGRT